MRELELAQRAALEQRFGSKQGHRHVGGLRSKAHGWYFGGKIIFKQVKSQAMKKCVIYKIAEANAAIAYIAVAIIALANAVATITWAIIAKAAIAASAATIAL